MWENVWNVLKNILYLAGSWIVVIALGIVLMSSKEKREKKEQEIYQLVQENEWLHQEVDRLKKNVESLEMDLSKSQMKLEAYAKDVENDICIAKRYMQDISGNAKAVKFYIEVKQLPMASKVIYRMLANINNLESQCLHSKQIREKHRIYIDD